MHAASLELNILLHRQKLAMTKCCVQWKMYSDYSQIHRESCHIPLLSAMSYSNLSVKTLIVHLRYRPSWRRVVHTLGHACSSLLLVRLPSQEPRSYKNCKVALQIR